MGRRRKCPMLTTKDGSHTDMCDECEAERIYIEFGANDGRTLLTRCDAFVGYRHLWGAKDDDHIMVSK